MRNYTGFIDSFKMETDEYLYHGGTLVEEVAALTSLCLGVRVKTAGATRRFTTIEGAGRPVRWDRKPTPILNMKASGRLLLPSIAGTHSLDQLSLLNSIPKIDSERYIKLIRACRFYQDAIWIGESEPNLAWLMLVSALEIAAEDVIEGGNDSPAQRLETAKPELASILKCHGGEDLLNEVAQQIIHTLGSTRKFIDFTLEFMPEEPTERPSEQWCINWSKTSLRKILNKVYGYRSRSLHGGIPFPYPMLEPPFYMEKDSPPSEIGMMGYGVRAYGGTWTAEDAPINLNCFHYIARGALLNWWRSMGGVQ